MAIPTGPTHACVFPGTRMHFPITCACRAVLKMDTWLRYPRHMFLRRPSPEDLHLFESEQGLQVRAAFGKLARFRGFRAWRAPWGICTASI